MGMENNSTNAAALDAYDVRGITETTIRGRCATIAVARAGASQFVEFVLCGGREIGEAHYYRTEREAFAAMARTAEFYATITKEDK